MAVRFPPEHATKVERHPEGPPPPMSPGVTIIVTPDDPQHDWFARKLAEVLQRVAKEEWT